jgi:hypothetical protein
MPVPPVIRGAALLLAGLLVGIWYYERARLRPVLSATVTEYDGSSWTWTAPAATWSTTNGHGK